MCALIIVAKFLVIPAAALCYFSPSNKNGIPPIAVHSSGYISDKVRNNITR